MVSLQWYLKLYHGEELIQTLGPYSYKEAEREAKKLGIPDRDRQ